MSTSAATLILAGSLVSSAVLSLAAVVVLSFVVSERSLKASQMLTRRPDSVSGHSAGMGESLETVLHQATALRRPGGTSTRPGVRLQDVIRLRPTDLNQAFGELGSVYRDGNVISIDLIDLPAPHATRLVDFCSGMATMSSGWIYRVTESVIVLSPPG